LKTVVFSQAGYLSCSCDAENVVVLCLTDPDLVAELGVSTIEGHILKGWKTTTPTCGRVCTTYNYSIEYNEAQLADPDTALTTAEVAGVFCKSCLTTWVEEQISHEITGLYILPETYGAVGDGSTDDSVAIQAAIDHAITLGGGAVFFSSGKDYLVEDTIYIPVTARNIQLLGYGASITGDVDGNILQIGDTSTTNNAARDIVISGLSIYGSGSTDTGNANQCGLEIDGVLRCALRDVQILNIPKTGIVGTKPVVSGSTYWNKVLFDNVSVRFCGYQCLLIGTSSAVDDLTCVNCIFNHGGEKITSNVADGAAYIKAIVLNMSGCEISGMYSQTVGFGYRWGLAIQTAGGFLSGMHFELNGYDQAGSADLFIDSASEGLAVIGSSHYGSDVTGAKFCIQTKGSGTFISNVSYAGNGTHQYDYVVEAVNAVDVQIGSINSLTATPIGVSETNLGGFGAGSLVNTNSYTKTGRRIEVLQSPYAGSNPPEIVIAGWGASATVTSVRAVDSHGDFTINCLGGGQTNPATITITFKDGDWPSEPTCIMYERTTGSGGTLSIPQVAVSAHRILFTANSTPVNNATYTFTWHCVGF
jgi:hypothetical protein